MTPTSQQQDFYRALLETSDNIALVARAGCGKTTTILGGVDAIVRQRPSAEIAVCAFNKAIADEVSEKLVRAGHTNWKKVQASTLHSMGFGLLKFVFRPKIDDKKVRNIVRNQNDEVYEQYGSLVEKMVRYAKQEGFGFFPDRAIGDRYQWYQMADHYDINSFDDTSDLDLVIELSQHIYRLSLAQTDVIDFDDMILMPLVKNLRVKFQKDFLFLDEAQDLSRTRQALARKFVKRNGGRMVVVGDDRQAIYGFSGADADALTNMIESLKATVLPLSVTWRCPQLVVERAQTIVPDIVAAPGAQNGVVDYIQELPEDVKIGDAILCRNTAPLITLAYSLIRKGTPAKVEGKAIGDGLKVLATRWKVKTIDALLRRLEDYKEREIQKAVAKDQEDKVEEIEDRVGTVVEICHECLRREKKNVSDVLVFIDDLFADGDDRSVTLATYHRSKGREWQRVILFEHSGRCPSKAARQDWQKVQEENLAYVAFTRAQHTLLFLN